LLPIHTRASPIASVLINRSAHFLTRANYF
jgi:hypothetical protein